MWGGASEFQYGHGKNLNAWQAAVEDLNLAAAETDREVQAAFRIFGKLIDMQDVNVKHMAETPPLEYEVHGVKVLTDPGVAADLRGLARVPADDVANAQVSARAARAVLQGVQRAEVALRQRGFGALWAGRIFVLPPVRAITGMAAKTGWTFKAAGHYEYSGDIVINPRDTWGPQRIAEIVVHELGHRYWFKHMRAGARARFAAWFDPRGKADQEREGPHAAYVPAPTAYAAEAPVEEFAETFSAYVLGRYGGVELTGPQRARFEALALGRAAQSEAAGGTLGTLLREFADRAGAMR
jgi:hypothetical protein